MSDDQQAEAIEPKWGESITPEQQAVFRWGVPIGDERKAKLKMLFDKQREWAAQLEAERGASQFKGVPLTGADVFWLAVLAVAGAQGSDGTAQAEEQLSKALEGVALRVLLVFVLQELHLEEAYLRAVHLERACLGGAHLEGADFLGAYLEGAFLGGAHLERAALYDAHLEGADFLGAYLEGAFLGGAHLERAALYDAHLEGADLVGAYLEGALLTSASFDKTSRLNGATLTGAKLDQVIFDNTNLTVVEWRAVQRIGDEATARTAKKLADKVSGFHAAARAYRALSVALRAQGLGNDATRFHYRAELMARYEQFYTIFARLRSRKFYRAPAAFGAWFLSWLLGTFAGYGDRLGRLFLTYLVTVSVFAGLMFAFSGRPPSFDSIRDVFVLSITSFHGRGIQPPGLHLNDALATLTAIEAFFGLAIEGIFIAAFTRRVTGN